MQVIWNVILAPSPSPYLSLSLYLPTHTHTQKYISDGVGRTGAFICIHTQMERMKTEGVVDFFQCIKSARIQRAGLVPDVVC